MERVGYHPVHLWTKIERNETYFEYVFVLVLISLYSPDAPPTFGIINVELEVGYVDESRVLVDIHHVWVQLGQVQQVLHEADQGQLHCKLIRNKQNSEVNMNDCMIYRSEFMHKKY